MTISVADPTRLPIASLDAEYRLAEFNSRRLPGQTWIQLGKRKLPTIIRAVGTPTGIIYASPGKQPNGLSNPATTAQLQATCYYGNAKGVYLQSPGDWWIYLDSATAETVVVYDDISTPAVLQSLGIVVVGSSGLSADVGNTDADGDFTKTNNALSVRGNVAIFNTVAGDWARLAGGAVSQVTGQNHDSNNVVGGNVIAHNFGRDTVPATPVVRSIEGRSIANFTSAADSLIALLNASVIHGRTAGGATISPIDCEGIVGFDSLSTGSTRRMLDAHAAVAGRDSANSVMRMVQARLNDPALGTAFGDGGTPIAGLVVNARQKWAPNQVTATAAAGSAVTATLPAPAAGLKHNIVAIEISKFAAQLLVAAATPAIVTTTNFVNGPSIDFPRAAAAQGTLDRYVMQPTLPIKSDVQGTATTFVAPATTDVIWKITIWYFED